MRFDELKEGQFFRIQGDSLTRKYTKKLVLAPDTEVIIFDPWTIKEMTQAQVEAIANAHHCNMEVDEDGDFMVTFGRWGADTWVQDGETLTPEIVLEMVNVAKEEDLKWSNLKWSDGLMCDALHRVGDDQAKSFIEEELAKEFADQPDVLDRIARIFAFNTQV